MNKQLLLVSIVAASLVFSGCMSGASRSENKKSTENKLVYPEPPEDPRFFYERTINSSADVLPDTETDKLRRAMTGESQRGEGFAKPYSIAVHHGRIFASDTARHVVLVFDIPMQKFFIIGRDEEDNEGRLAKPMGLDVDGQGNLYVLDARARQVVIYDRDGKFIRNVGQPNDFTRPAGIGVNSEGTRIYAVDIGGSSTDNHRVVVYDAITGARLPDIGKRGVKPGEVNLPRDVAVAADGTIYVVDGGNFRVQHLSADGKEVLGTFGSIGRQMGQFSRPKEADIDNSGNIYVIDAAFGNFQLFNADGKLLMHIGQRSNVNGPGLFSLPSGVSVDDDGRVYVVDQFFRKIEVFRPAGISENEGYVFDSTNEKAKSAPMK